MKAHEEHRHKAPEKIRIAVFTASSSRYYKKLEGQEVKDESGEKAVEILQQQGYEVSYLGVVNDDVNMIRRKIIEAVDAGFDVVIVNGGTGLARRDVTIEAVKPFLEKEMEGFGEILRIESYKKIGAAAAMTRSAAGVYQGRILIALPGSPDAVTTALNIFGREFPHMVYIARG